MDATSIKEQAVKFMSARNNLLVVVGFTAINIVLAVAGADFYFLFSAALPMFFYYLTVGMAYASGVNAFVVAGVVIALIGTGFYLLCWYLSKKWRVFILIALILFSIDTLVYALLLMDYFDGFDVNLLIEIAFRAWVLYYLVTGTVAWSKLKNVSAEEVQSAQQEASSDAEAQETDSALNELSDNDISDSPDE